MSMVSSSMTLLIAVISLLFPGVQYAEPIEIIPGVVLEQVRDADMDIMVDFRIEQPEEMSTGMSMRSTVQVNTSEDLKKIQLHAASVMLSRPYDDGETVPFNFDIWCDIDMSNQQNPVLDFIFKSDDHEQYIYQNMAEGFGARSLAQLEMLKDFSLFKADMQFDIESIDGKHTLRFNDAQAKLLVADIADTVFERLLEMNTADYYESVGVIGGADGPTAIILSDDSAMMSGYEEAINSMRAQFAEIFEKIADVRIFSDDAIILEIEEQDGVIQSERLSINVDANAREAAENITPYAEGYPEKVVGGLNLEAVYNAVNQGTQITFPELNEQNTMYPFNPNINDYLIFYNNTKTDSIEKIVIDQVDYLPLRRTLNAMNVDDNDITYDNGNIKFSIDQLLFETNIDTSVLIREGMELGFENNLLLIDGTTYAPSLFFQYFSRVIPGSGRSGGNISVYVYEPYYSILIDQSFVQEYEAQLTRTLDKLGEAVSVMVLEQHDIIEKMNLVLASGEPSIFILQLTPDTIERLEQQNAALPLYSYRTEQHNQYFAQPSDQNNNGIIPVYANGEKTEYYAFISYGYERMSATAVEILNELFNMLNQ